MKLSKVLSIIAVVLMLTLSVSNFVYAAPVNLDPSGIKGEGSTGLTDVETFGKKILGAIQTVGVTVAVIILAVLGIKYMMGSASEKAEYKKTMMPYIIGALLLFGASWVSGMVYNLVTGLK